MVPSNERAWLLKEKYNGVESDAFIADLTRLEKREPLAYVIGFVPFLGCRIDVGQHTLIPRTETEYWVEKVIANIQAQPRNNRAIRCLDIFAGSGCIGVAVLAHIPKSEVDFVDIDPAAVEQTQINTTKNNIAPGRYSVQQSDMFAAIPPGARYDYIFANPPYIAYKDQDRIEAAVLAHEPHQALFSGETGLELLAATIERAQEFLIPGGTLYMEYDDIQKDALEELLQKTPNIEYIFHKDQYDLWRWLEITHK